MIAVIADDFTGAAEIGGIALRHGLSVEIDTRVHAHAEVDVLVIATDCRSKSEAEAKGIVREVTKDLLALSPGVIFKKTDSLMRGHVAQELVAQMEISGKGRVLLIPANPSLERTIRDGVYYAGGVPLNESHLANAARNKIVYSGVLDLLGEISRPFTHVISLQDELPHTGLMIGNTITETDLDHWVHQLDADTIPAGSGGFFNAFLKRWAPAGNKKLQDTVILGKRVIYICGSAFPLSKASVAEARSRGRCVSYMPTDIFCSGIDVATILEQWANDIEQGLKQTGQVVIAVDEVQYGDFEDVSNEIRLGMATVIEKVMQRTEVNELVIEGGATASSIIEKLNYKRFFPKQELAVGVIRMKVEGNQDLFLTMKPGSYQWPSSIWRPTLDLLV